MTSYQRCRRCGVRLRDFYHPGPALPECPSAAVLRQEAYFAELEFERRMQAIEAREEAAAATYYDVDRDDAINDMDELRDRERDE
jgi:hypothetical protein